MVEVDDGWWMMDHVSGAADVNSETHSSGGTPTGCFSLRNCVGLVLIVCVLLGIAFPAILSSREKSRRLLCTHNLAQVGLGLLNYHETYRQFPYPYVLDQNGQRRFGWRVGVLPFITSNNLYDKYCAAYRNTEKEFSLAPYYEIDLPFFRCPSEPVQPGTTSYFAVTGGPTAWPAPLASCLPEFAQPCRSILIVESSKMGIHWVEPRDLQFDQVDFAIRSRSSMGFPSPGYPPAWGISSEHRNGANAVFADGGVQFLARDTPPKMIEQMLVIRNPPVHLQPGIRCRWVRDPESTNVKFPYKMTWYPPNE
jgi:prepilin-type processing-associated H-X9-DG protein